MQRKRVKGDALAVDKRKKPEWLRRRFRIQESLRPTGYRFPDYPEDETGLIGPGR